MDRILVSGLINIETTVRIDGFPIEYHPVRYPFYGVSSTVSGVGYNVAKALTALGRPVSFVSMIGTDLTGDLVLKTMDADLLPTTFVQRLLVQTPQSVILYDAEGRRQINVDLKNIQETSYPSESFEEALQGVSAAVLCNINFSRPFLSRCRERGILTASDVHAIADRDDPYNADFMAAADILFMSDERLPCPPELWARGLQEQYGTPIVVVGMGKRGALLADRQAGFLEVLPAVTTRPVVNTIGAGDALFSSFLHFFLKSRDARAALRKAQIFASWKIGETGAASGFLSEAACEALGEKTG